ncbi:MAG: nitrous oxide reductase accessory protein NosL [Halobacteriota archaeon]
MIHRRRSGDGDRTRRTVLRGIGTSAVVAIAGCLGDAESAPEPVALDDGQACDECGMVIGEHPGPNGQVYFEGDRPADRDGPAWFCSGVCTYTYRFDREEEGWTSIVTYLTDYSKLSYTVSGDSRPVISAHFGPETYSDEADLFVVAGSDVLGAMGNDVIPFGDQADADAFAAEYGGSVLEATAIDRELIDSIRA